MWEYMIAVTGENRMFCLSSPDRKREGVNNEVCLEMVLKKEFNDRSSTRGNIAGEGQTSLLIL